LQARGLLWLRVLLIKARQWVSVMAGLDPAIHVFLGSRAVRRGCPGQARA
jgi:hypothetical protein